MPRFLDLTIDDEFLTGTRGASAIRFTRQERAVLKALVDNPQRLMRRDQLLDAISASGSAISDRNIDFLVNRLRAKLGDNARAPLFIATQYGEGYVWIAAEQSQPVRAFLAVGPASGVDQATDPRRLRAWLARVAAFLGARLDSGPVVVAADLDRNDRRHELRFCLETGFHEVGGQVHCAAVLREMPAANIVRAFRLTIKAVDAMPLDAAGSLASDVASALWNHAARPPSGPPATRDEPLELRVHNASLMLAGNGRSWLESEERLAGERRRNPEDPETAMMWGMCLLARLILADPFAGRDAIDRGGIEDEIETLVLDALAKVQHRPMLALAAAKLLFFIDRGHLELAEELAERSFAASTAFAASFALLGQLRMVRGRFDEATGFYDGGIELAEQGSEFHVYLLVLKCIAHMASADRPALEATRATLFATKPATMLEIGPFTHFADEAVPPSLEDALALVGPVGALRLAEHLDFIGARHFLAQRHRDNVMRGLVGRLVRLHGAGAFPPDFWTRFPGLGDLRAGSRSGARAVVL